MRHSLIIVATLLASAPDTAHASPTRAEGLTKAAMQLDANPGQGGVLYRAQCVACHGVRGQGNAVKAVPALAGQRRAYLLMQFANFSERDRTATQMHKVVVRSDVREPQAWADLASFLGSLPPMSAGQTGNGEHVSLGEASYRQWCSTCHDDDARGDEEGFVPSLRNQHYGYLLKEMYGIAAGHRANADTDLVRFLDSLAAPEMTGIADYLSRQHGPVRDRGKLRTDGSISE